jgi:predicted RNA-binding Zn-ribbon protein involved in translation (DUF1610 family)
MTLDADEFMRRFLLHVLPSGFHRIRHYGLLANGNRTASLTRIRELLQQAHAAPQTSACDAEPESARPSFFCPHCGGPMIVLQTFARGQPIRAPPEQTRAP